MIGEAVLPLTVDPLTPCFGARVHHDLSRPATADQADALRCALDRHRVLVFPGQHLNHADLLAAGRLFGTIDTSTDRRYTVAGFPGLTVISNITEDGRRIGVYDGDQEEEWHADNSYKRELTSTTLLYSVITPDEGGDTRFADATTAYADLPDLLKSRVDTLEATHSIQQLGAMQAHASAGHSSAATGTLAGLDEVRHPLAPRHPVTGKRTLLLGSMVIKDIPGLTAADTSQLLTALLTHTTSDRYLYRHRWTHGDLVVWDNQAVLHTASPCDSSRHHRLLYRAAVC